MVATCRARQHEAVDDLPQCRLGKLGVQGGEGRSNHDTNTRTRSRERGERGDREADKWSARSKLTACRYLSSGLFRNSKMPFHFGYFDGILVGPTGTRNLKAV